MQFSDLATFLNLHEYEIIFMLKKLAVDIFEKGDQVLNANMLFTLSPYQVVLKSFTSIVNT